MTDRHDHTDLEADLRSLSTDLWVRRVRLAGLDPETVTVDQEATMMRDPLATAQALIDQAVEAIELASAR